MNPDVVHIMARFQSVSVIGNLKAVSSNSLWLHPD